MVQLTAFVAILALSSPLALSHPLRRRQLSGDPLLQNGLEAQKLNVAFQGLKASDNCTNGDIACVEGALALCRGDSWVTQNCPQTLQCFALPDIDKEGVTIGCTSAKTAESLIEATGAQGGLGSVNGTNITSPDAGSSGSSTVTVTVTLPADGQTQTLSSSTATLTPEQAGSIISSSSAAPTNPPVAVANSGAGTTIILGGGAPSSAPTPSPLPADGGPEGGLGGASPPPGTTIILNGAGAPSPAATPAAAAASAAPPAAPPSGSSGYY